MFWWCFGNRHVILGSDPRVATVPHYWMKKEQKISEDIHARSKTIKEEISVRVLNI
jgi:hypothetical protein